MRRRKRADAGEALLERLAFEQLHGDVRHVAVNAVVEDLDDGRMGQAVGKDCPVRRRKLFQPTVGSPREVLVPVAFERLSGRIIKSIVGDESCLQGERQKERQKYNESGNEDGDGAHVTPSDT